MGSNETVDLTQDLAKAKEQINTDALANIAMRLQEAELKAKLLKIDIDSSALEQEQLRIVRLQKNNERRPYVFWGLALVIVVMYTLLLILIFRDQFYTCPVLLQAAGRIHFLELALLAIVPTVLVALLMKAVFSATPKKDQDGEIKISDAIPLKLITSNVDKATGS